MESVIQNLQRRIAEASIDQTIVDAVTALAAQKDEIVVAVSVAHAIAAIAVAGPGQDERAICDAADRMTFILHEAMMQETGREIGARLSAGSKEGD